MEINMLTVAVLRHPRKTEKIVNSEQHIGCPLSIAHIIVWIVNTFPVQI